MDQIYHRYSDIREFAGLLLGERQSFPGKHLFPVGKSAQLYIFLLVCEVSMTARSVVGINEERIKKRYRDLRDWLEGAFRRLKKQLRQHSQVKKEI